MNQLDIFTTEISVYCRVIRITFPLLLEDRVYIIFFVYKQRCPLIPALLAPFLLRSRHSVLSSKKSYVFTDFKWAIFAPILSFFTHPFRTAACLYLSTEQIDHLLSRSARLHIFVVSSPGALFYPGWCTCAAC
ncbi:hypothetical protein D3C87_1803860 [compost metagenome]